MDVPKVQLQTQFFFRLDSVRTSSTMRAAAHGAKAPFGGYVLALPSLYWWVIDVCDQGGKVSFSFSRSNVRHVFGFRC